MRTGSTIKVLAKRMQEYYRISWCLGYLAALVSMAGVLVEASTNATLMATAFCHHVKARSYHMRLVSVDPNSGSLVPMQDEHNNARIADIGLSKVLAGQDVQASPGTTLWASPEQIQVTADFFILI